MKLKFAYGIVPGLSSIGQGLDRQSQIRFVNESGIAAACLADAAGTRDRSRFYAELAAEATASFLTEQFEALYSMEESKIKRTVLEKIEEAFRKAGLKLSDVRISLLFTAVKPEHYLAGNMEGGLIVALENSSTVLSDQESASSGNLDFAEQIHQLEGLKLYRGELGERSGFMLISDGACRSLYESTSGSLSPACNTFFEWLRDYDAETVSEALADNIEKYFLKDTRGDVGIAIMVPDGSKTIAEAATEPTAESAAENTDKGTGAGMAEGTDDPAAAPSDEDPEESRKEEGSRESVLRERKATQVSGRKRVKYVALAVILVVAVILIFALKQSGESDPKHADKADIKPPLTQAQNSANSDTERKGGKSADAQPDEMEPTISFSAENPVSYEPGQYEIGQDIPPGEYFFWTGEMLEPDSIEINGESCLSGELYCMTIQVESGDTLYSNYRFTPASNVNPVKAAKGILISGKYKIGKDIVPGNYKISPVDKQKEGKYYSVFNGKIENAETFSGATTVTVPAEGYIVFYQSILQVQK